jgi:hypothetical protein
LINKFARRIVMPVARTNGGERSYLPSMTVSTGRRVLCLDRAREKKMKKAILAIAGSALIVFSGVQFAAAAERHHGRTHHRSASELRDSNAYAAPPVGYGYGYGSEAEPEWYRYSGGYSDMAGH